MNIFEKYPNLRRILANTVYGLNLVGPVYYELIQEKKASLNNIAIVDMESRQRDCYLLATIADSANQGEGQRIYTACLEAAKADLVKRYHIGDSNANVPVPVPPVPTRADETPAASPISYRSL